MALTDRQTDRQTRGHCLVAEVHVISTLGRSGPDKNMSLLVG